MSTGVGLRLTGDVTQFRLDIQRDATLYSADGRSIVAQPANRDTTLRGLRQRIEGTIVPFTFADPLPLLPPTGTTTAGTAELLVLANQSIFFPSGYESVQNRGRLKS